MLVSKSMTYFCSLAKVTLGGKGKNIPNFDIAEFYTASDVRDLLIRNQRLGEQLAKSFAFDDEGPKHPVVLMRGHGLTIVGNSIKQSVFRAIYTAENAKVQTIAMSLQAAASSRQAEPNVTTMRYLDDTELSATAEMTDWSSQRPWMLWIKEIELNGLYVNTC